MKKTHRLPIEAIQKYDPEAVENIAYLNSLYLMSVGVVPFPRKIPGLFLDTYEIYSAFAPDDIHIMREHMQVHTLAEHKPKEANKVKSTNYLVGNFYFQRFLATRRLKPTLLFSNASVALIDRVKQMGAPYIATVAEVNERFKTKKAFREALKDFDLPHIPHRFISHETISSMNYRSYSLNYYDQSVIQRSEIEVGGNEGTFFIKSDSDFKYFQSRITEEGSDTEYMISPFIVGDSVSMAGCVTRQGILTGPLQLQLIDVPESLHGAQANGIFYGNDWGYKNWNEHIQKQAERVTEVIGTELQKEGFMGIFGIDFMYESKSGKLYPLECNPRITGSMPALSLMQLAQDIPPFEYYHLLSLTKKDTTFDFELANESLKHTFPCAHISFSPMGIETMRLPLVAGVYTYDRETEELNYVRRGFHYTDIESDNEFIIIDALPKMGEKVQQHVPGFFKFLFKRQIADGSDRITKRTQDILEIFTHNLKHPPSSV
jgi:predicted ATP-grasp superfamily ATP-dependent carboligase